MIEEMNVSLPCICGSGKAYVECCKERMDGLIRGERVEVITPEPQDAWNDFDELLDEFDRLITEMRFEESLEVFRQILVQSGDLGPMRALVLVKCFKKYGLYEYTLKNLQSAVAVCSVVDGSLLASLALIQYRLGHEEESRNALLLAMSLPIPLGMSVVEVCELLALQGRHKEIIEFARRHLDGIQDGMKGYVRHYLGIAFANTGDMKSAMKYLSQVKSTYFDTLASDCLKRMRRGGGPYGIFGEWPYPPQLSVMADIEGILPDKLPMHTSWFAEFVRQVIEWKQEKKQVETLGRIVHPRAREILEGILKWPHANAEVKKMAEKMLAQSFSCGEETVQLRVIPVEIPDTKENLMFRSDHEYRGYFPTEEVEAKYKDLIDQLRSGQEKEEDVIEKLFSIHRDYPEVEAVTCTLGGLLNLANRTEEGEKMLLGILEKNPEYYMAFYMLEEFYGADRRFDEALALAERYRLKGVLHPVQANLYWCAMARLNARMGDMEKAFKYVKCAESVVQDDMMCQDAREFVEHEVKLREKGEKAMEIVMKDFNLTHVPDEEREKLEIKGEIPIVKIKVTEEMIDKILQQGHA